MEEIAIGFRRSGFVVHVRRFTEVQNNYKILSESLKTVCGCRINELH